MVLTRIDDEKKEGMMPAMGTYTPERNTNLFGRFANKY